MIIVSLALLLAACVTDFTPEVKGVSGILVVDGTITDGGTISVPPIRSRTPR